MRATDGDGSRLAGNRTACSTHRSVHPAWRLGCAGLLLLTACDTPPSLGPLKSGPTARVEDFGAISASSLPPASTPAATQIILHVLHLRVPDSYALESIWQYSREDAVDSRTAARLQRNGLRAAVIHAEWWPEVKSAFEEVPGLRIHRGPPLPIVPPTGLELALDSQPRDQSLFTLDDAGAISGETWPDSQNFLLAACSKPDDDVLTLTLTPFVRQRLEQPRWVHTGSAWQPGSYSGRTFANLAVSADIRAGDMLMLGPAGIPARGLLGNAFLVQTEEHEQQRYLSFIIVQPEWIPRADDR